MSADLVTWLNSALDEDQKAAEACINEVGAHRAGEMYSDGSGTADYDAFPSYPWGSDGAELAYMAGPGHPARVLAEVAAKRDLLQLHSPAGITSDPPYKWACSVCHRRDGWWAGEYPCTTVRLLAAPFASRAGFDPSWLD